MSRVLWIPLALSALLIPGVAPAHVGAIPEAFGVVLDPGGGQTLAVETSFGLLAGAESQEFVWFCHEAIIELGSFVTPRYVLSDEAVWLGVTGTVQGSRELGESLYRSADGCSWDVVAGLSGRVVTAAAYDSGDPQLALAVTATVGQQEQNGVYRSTDGGATWSLAGALQNERLYRSVSIDSTGVAWATSSWFFPDHRAWITRSVDGGLSWDEQEVVFEVDGVPQPLIEVVETGDDGQSAWFKIDGLQVDHLLYTSDGGQTLDSILSVDGELLGVTLELPQTLWVAADDGRLFRSVAGGAFELDKPSPGALDIAWGQQGLFLVTDNLQGNPALMRKEGSAWLGVFGYADLLGPPQCADETHSALRCEPFWEQLSELLASGDDDDSAGDDDDSAGDDDDSAGDDDDSSGDDDDGDDDDDSSVIEPVGCGCGYVPGSSASNQVLLLVAFWLLQWAGPRLRGRQR